MTHIARATAPTFDLAGTTFVGLSSPSRGATENSVWQTTVPAHSQGIPHTLDREETLVILRGSGTATIGQDSHELAVGDTLIVPPNTMFSVATDTAELELLAILPVGGRVALGDVEPFTPPWAL